MKKINLYNHQIKELYEIENPSNISDESKKEIWISRYKNKNNPVEVKLESGDAILLTVNKKDYFKILTNRNKNFISKEEQATLAGKKIGIIGMSIGGNISVALAHSGIGVAGLYIADFDILSNANLNRVRSNLLNVGKKKVDIVSSEIEKINPFQKIVKFENGIKSKDVDRFVKSVDLVIEECDDFEIKVLLRVAAKKYSKPLIMVTNIGDNVLVDTERYDTQKETTIFNGLVEEWVINKIISKNITEDDKKKFAISIVGPENIPSRGIESVMQIGKTLVGRPQLMSTVMVGAGFACMMTRKILLGETAVSGRKKFIVEV